MGLLNCASRYSVWHGYDYYKNKRVESLIKYSDCDFSGVVKGTKKYEVKINAEHPRKSSCNCPRANGKRTICKHMIALYFAAFPEEAEKYYNTVKKKAEEAEKYRQNLENKVIDYIFDMNKEQLQNELINMLFDSPEWFFRRFIIEHDIQDRD